ncbi:TRAP transporter small permease [Microbacterium sp. zg.B48]|uniref:TRAP transporter small permease subunit n=1 Tax=Microbacterium sp. zg.B48 TaxID=2969408 RepID=UPI00214B8BAF|nr:TRAP transporter small permease [Microbacterium sp. zg.B48]MCR2764353.1 TRAP transporter small permease [Microbacterium sp. zg.B48]
MSDLPGLTAPGLGAPGWVRAVDALTRGAAGVAAVATVLMGLHIVADVIGRAVFNHPLPATLEIVSFMWMPTIVYLAVAYAQLKNEHLRVTLSVERLHGRSRRIADVVGFGIGGLVIGMMTAYAWMSAARSVAILEMRPAVIYVPLWPFRVVVVIGLLLLLGQTAATIQRVLRGARLRDGAIEEQEILAELDGEVAHDRRR